MSEAKPKHLAIQGKVINVEKIGEKTLAQFKAQLKQNGVTLEDEQVEFIYNSLKPSDDGSQSDNQNEEITNQ